MTECNGIVEVKKHMREDYPVEAYTRACGKSHGQDIGKEKEPMPLPVFEKGKDNTEYYELCKKSMDYRIRFENKLPIPDELMGEMKKYGLLMGKKAELKKCEADLDSEFLASGLKKLEELEGRSAHSYADTKGKVTVGNGSLVETRKNMEKLPLHEQSGTKATLERKGEDYDKTLLRRDELEKKRKEELKELVKKIAEQCGLKQRKGLPKSKVKEIENTCKKYEKNKKDRGREYNHTADKYLRDDSLILPVEEIKRLRDKNVREHLSLLKNKLKKEGINFHSMPQDVKEVLFDMQFNMGENFVRERDGEKKWPKFFDAIKSGKWEDAAKECESGDIQPSRNEWRKSKLMKAAKETAKK